MLAKAQEYCVSLAPDTAVFTGYHCTHLLVSSQVNCDQLDIQLHFDNLDCVRLRYYHVKIESGLFAILGPQTATASSYLRKLVGINGSRPCSSLFAFELQRFEKVGSFGSLGRTCLCFLNLALAIAEPFYSILHELFTSLFKLKI